MWRSRRMQPRLQTTDQGRRHAILIPLLSLSPFSKLLSRKFKYFTTSTHNLLLRLPSSQQQLGTERAARLETLTCRDKEYKEGRVLTPDPSLIGGLGKHIVATNKALCGAIITLTSTWPFRVFKVFYKICFAVSFSAVSSQYSLYPEESH